MENKKEKFEYPELTLEKYDTEDVMTDSGIDFDEDIWM